MKRYYSALVVLALASAVPAFAVPGDAAAVLAHCGTPDGDTTAPADIDGQPQRTLTYGNMRLKFSQQQGATTSGWNFTNGWAGRLPMTASEVGSRLPCFRDGLDEALVRYQNVAASEDPAIAQQTATPVQQPHSLFGINHLFMILVLALVVGLFAFLVPRRKEMVEGPAVSNRVFRRPRLDSIRGRRRPRVLPERS